MRLSKQAGARIETVPEVLVVLYFEEQRPSLTSRTSSWSASLRWLDSIRPIITRRAYSGFCLGVVGSRAAREGAYTAFPELLHRAFRNGSPRLWHVLPFLAYWLTPQGFRGCCEVCYAVGRSALRLNKAAVLAIAQIIADQAEAPLGAIGRILKEMNNELARRSSPS